MLSVHHHTRERSSQYARDQLREFAVAKDGSVAEFANVHLVQNFARSSQRLDENGLLVCDRIGDAVKIFERQRQVLGEGTVVVDDAEDGAPGTVGFEPTPAEFADRTITVGGARDVDFAGDAVADPAGSLGFREAQDLGHFADEFVARSATKRVVAAQDFHIGVADSGKTDAHSRPAAPQPWKRRGDPL